MEKFIIIKDFLVANQIELVGVVMGMLAVAELIVRMTPTKKDDGFVQRIGNVIKKALDIVKIPNVIKKDDSKLK